MCPSHQDGFSLPLALFIIVILALLSNFLIQVTAVGQKSVAREVLTAKALFAAESGANIAIMSIFPISGAAPVCSGVAQTTNYSSAGLVGCSSSVTCNSVTESGKTVYELLSVGSCGANASYQSQRSIRVKLSDVI